MKHNTQFIGFTSAFGGSGCTSLAMAFARIATIFHKRKVLFLSFDYLGCKMAPGVAGEGGLRTALLCASGDQFQDIFESLCNADDIGVSYLKDNSFDNYLYHIASDELGIFLELISENTSFDLVVFDVPYRSEIANHVLITCDNIIVNLGYKDVQIGPNSALKDHIDNLFISCSKAPRIGCFKPEEDPDSFYIDTIDIHGQFGGEVRALAEKLLS